MKTNIKIALMFCMTMLILTGYGVADTSVDTSSVDDDVVDIITSEIFLVDDQTDDIPHFEGVIGPEHAMYGLKIAFGNVEAMFTYNESERLGKQVSAAKHRIAESRVEIKKGNDRAAGIALGHYKDKMDEIDIELTESDLSSMDLMQITRKISEHELVLTDLIKEMDEDESELLDDLHDSLDYDKKVKEKLVKKVKKEKEDDDGDDDDDDDDDKDTRKKHVDKSKDKDASKADTRSDEKGSKEENSHNNESDKPSEDEKHDHSHDESDED